MATEQHIPSRRALLGVIAATPILALPASALAKPSTEWDRLAADYHRAKSASDHYCKTIKGPKLATLDRMAPKPSLTIVETSQKCGSITIELDPSELSENTWNPVRQKRINELRADWEEYERLHSMWSDRLNINAVSKKSQDLFNAVWDAEEVLMDFPAPHAAALALKVLIAFENGRAADGYREACLSDARRLGGH